MVNRGRTDVQKSELHVARLFQRSLDVSNVPFRKTIASSIVWGARYVCNPPSLHELLERLACILWAIVCQYLIRSSEHCAVAA